MVSIYFARPKPEGLTRLRQIVEELGGRVERPASIEEKIAEERRATAAADEKRPVCTLRAMKASWSGVS
ncbi:MAG: hypothetical protein ABSH31_23560 [Bryobacteraceae bacterium]